MTNPKEVIQFLKDNPDFFRNRSDLVNELDFGDDGNSSLFYERQLQVLKERESRQQNKIDLIVDSARNNLELESELHSLAINLLSDGQNRDSVEMVTTSIKRQFNMKEVVILHSPENGTEPHPSYDELRQRVLHKSSICDDRVSSKLLDAIFSDESRDVQSCAFIPLVYQSEFRGILVLGSQSRDRFSPGSGVLYLDRLGQLVAGYLQGR